MKQCSRRNKDTLEKCGMPFEGSGSYCKECRNEYQREYYAMRKYHPTRARSAELGIGCVLCGVGLRSNTLEVIDHPLLEKPMQLCGPCKAAVTYAGRTVDEATTEAIVDAILTISRITHADAVEAQKPEPTTFSDFERRHYPPSLSASEHPNLRSVPLKPYVPVSDEEMARRAAKHEAGMVAMYGPSVISELAALPTLQPLPVESLPSMPILLQEACGACDKPARPSKKYCEEHEKEMDYKPGELNI
jgi:hypothetical protein